MIRWLVIVALLLPACSKPTPPAPKASKPVAKKALKKPKVEAKKRKKRPKRKKMKLPTPTPPPPRPEGEPKNPEDLRRLSTAAETGQPVQKPGAPPIKRLDAYRLRVGKVFVDRLKRVVEAPAQVNMTEGILDYFAVSSEGKLHEAVIEVFAEPSHIHLGLLLIGLEPTVWDRSDTKSMPKIVKAGGDLKMFVRFTDPKGGEKRQIPAEAWLYNRKLNGAPKANIWTFQGSAFWNGRYSADMDRSISTLIPDSSAVLNSKVDIGNPYRGNDLGYEVFTKVIPPKGTRVTYVLEAMGPKPPHPTQAPPAPTKAPPPPVK